MKFIVYLTINTKNRKIYVGVHKQKDEAFDGYIGCGISRQLKTLPKNPTPFHRAVLKYGYEAFVRITLGIFDTAEEAYAQEKEIVTKEFIQRKDVYNIALGGKMGVEHTTKILQYSADGKFIKQWESVIDAYTFFNKKSGNRLVKCLTGKTQTYLGYQWRYFTEDYPLVIAPAKTLEIPLHQYNVDGMYVKTWKNKLKAAKALDCSSSGLRHATQSLKLYAEFQWRYFLGEPPETIPAYIDPDIVLQINKDTGEIIKEWPKLVKVLEAGYQVSKAMIPRTSKAKKFKWIYKKDYIRL